MAAIERLRVYPVKGLDGIDLDAAAIRDGGTLEFDREFALFDADGDVVNAKRTPAVHRLSTEFDPSTGEYLVDSPDDESVTFVLPDESARAAAWFGDYFDEDLTLEREASVGYVDRPRMGPSVVSTATIQAVASWFDELTVEGARRRLRANVEISDVPAFWEDRFVGPDAPDFVAGDVRFEGVTPCGRCVVPQRDPDTGEPTPDFRETFLEQRRASFPDWADEDAFDHYYSLMILTDVPDADRNGQLRVGDQVTVADE